MPSLRARVAPRVAATHSGVRKSRVMATSYTEIVELLEVKNVYSYTIPSFSDTCIGVCPVQLGEPRCLFHEPSAMSTCHKKTQRIFDK